VAVCHGSIVTVSLVIDLDARLLEHRDDHVDQALRVGLVVVDDQHRLGMEVVDHVVGVLGTLDVVVGDHAEERRVLATGGQGGQGR
jgi:hypothetical protein